MLLLPTIGFLIRDAVKRNSTETEVKQLAKDIRELVESKNKDHKEIVETIKEIRQRDEDVHQEITATMRLDREATDKRLRFIEEYWMKRGQQNN